MKTLEKLDISSLSKDELLQLLIKQQKDHETELSNAKKTVAEQVTKEVTARVTKEVTDKVTKEVTDKVTKEVTDKLTREFQKEMNRILAKIADKNLIIRRYNKEMFDTKSEHRSKSPVEINEAEKHVSKKGRNTGGKNFADIDFESLVEKVTICDIDIRKCPDCQCELIKIGEDISYKLYRKPAAFYVEKIITPKYKCPNDERIFQAVSDRVFPHSCLTPELASSIIDSKLGLGEPLDRQSRYLKNHGFPFSTQTLSNWYMNAAELLHPLYECIREHLVNTTCRCINADETTIKVLDNEKKGRKTSYVFCYLSSFYDNPIYLYDFRTERSGEHAKDILKGFDGYLTCDGYPGYNLLKEQGVRINRCWVHARREFLNIIKGMPESEQKKTKTYKVVRLFNDVFRLDSMTDDMTPEERKKFRNSDKFHKKVDELNAFVRSLNPEKNTPLAKAVNYFIKAWPDMQTFFEDGHLELSNNAAERAIKPFVIDRKNFLFCKTENGADATAELFSIIQTSQANLLIPDQYLTWAMYNVGKLPIEELLPWSEKISDEIHIHKKNLEQKTD